MLRNKTCASCERNLLSSYTKECVECLNKDTKDNRFPNWIPEKKE
jgi:hypothetical protein